MTRTLLPPMPDGTPGTLQEALEFMVDGHAIRAASLTDPHADKIFMLGFIAGAQWRDQHPHAALELEEGRAEP